MKRCIERALIISRRVCPCIRGEAPDVVDMMVPWGALTQRVCLMPGTLECACVC